MAKAQKRQMKALTGPILSKYLRSLAVDIETMDDEQNPLTKAAVLAKLVWRAALGWTELDPKTAVETVHEPDWRANTLLFDRMEGRVVAAITEDTGRSLTEKVSALGKAKMNALAKAATEDSEDESGAD